MPDHVKRSTNHSIDRFLLVAALRRFYQGFLVFPDERDELRRLAASWTPDERERWDTEHVLTAPFLTRVMNVCLGGESAETLWLESGARLGELRALMQLQYESGAALMNSAVDDFGLDNLEWAGELPGGRVRVRVKSAVWAGAKQWLLQHAGACRLADVPGQEQKRAELARALAEAAREYE